MMFDQIDIYPVISDPKTLKAVIAGGAKIVQLRDKSRSKPELFELAQKFRRITAAHGILFMINDYVDIAKAVDADGVHLGQNDMPLKFARELAPNLIFGVSTHNIEEAKQAEREGANYINIGSIFATQTKNMQPLGLKSIEVISSEVKIPFTVMGGIKLDNLEQVLEAGARKIAVVTAITLAKDPVAATQEFIRRIRAYGLN